MRCKTVKKRIVVTGIGIISPVGLDKDSYWNALSSGRSGVGKITRFDVSDYTTRVAAEVKDFDPARYMDKREAKKMDLFTQFAVAASLQAWEDAGLHYAKGLDKDRTGVAVGSGIGGIWTIEEQLKVLHEKGPRRVSPFLVPMLIANMASGYVSILLELRGPNTTIVTACATATHAIGESCRIIQRGDADCMIAGGSEAAISPLALGGFCSARALTTRNDEPERASRPFDKERDGFVMGEGAGIVILESLESALKRNARIYGEIVGYGMSGDAYHITSPDPDGTGAYLAMKRALENSGLAPEEVDYINAHGTSTAYNDRIETVAIKRLLGEHAYRVAISSTKSMIGHLLGAAGGAELIATLLSMNNQVLCPTVNYEYPDPECDLDYVPNVSRQQKFDVAISNSFGFGGTNASLIVKRYDHE